MSNAFEDREKAFEAKYQRDQEADFKVAIRRAKLLGLWAADLMGLPRSDADAYAQSLIELELAPGHHDIAERVLNDLTARKADCSPEKLNHQITRLNIQAREQVEAEQAAKPM